MIDRLDTLAQLEKMTEQMHTIKDRSRLRLSKPNDVNGANVYYFKRQLEQNLLPTTGTYFAHLDANIKRGEYRVAWNIIASDGSRFPEIARYSYFTIEVV